MLCCLELGAVQSKNVLVRDPKMNHKDHKYVASVFYPNVFQFFIEHIFST